MNTESSSLSIILWHPSMTKKSNTEQDKRMLSSETFLLHNNARRHTAPPEIQIGAVRTSTVQPGFNADSFPFLHLNEAVISRAAVYK